MSRCKSINNALHQVSLSKWIEENEIFSSYPTKKSLLSIQSSLQSTTSKLQTTSKKTIVSQIPPRLRLTNPPVLKEKKEKKKKQPVKRLFRTVSNLPIRFAWLTWSLTCPSLACGEGEEKKKEKICATKRGARRERARKLRSWRGGFVHKRKSIRQRGWTTGEWRSATLGAFRGRGSGDRKGGPYETFQWELHHNGLVVYIY